MSLTPLPPQLPPTESAQSLGIFFALLAMNGPLPAELKINLGRTLSLVYCTGFSHYSTNKSASVLR